MGLYLYRGNGSSVAGVIVIGSNVIKMKISQIYRSKIVDLETLEYPISIGHEVFSTGKISFNSVREISSILSGYLKLFDEYKIINYKVLGTTAFREAENREFVIDQLRVQNGLNVEILELNYEEMLICSNIIRQIDNNESEEQSGKIIANISSGNLGLSLYENGAVKFSHNVPIGYMRVYDMFSEVIESGEDISSVLEEYMNVMVKRMKYWLSPESSQTLIVTGNDISLISEICNAQCDGNRFNVEIDELTKLYDSFKTINLDRLSIMLNLNTEKTKLACSILSICLGILKIANIKSVTYVKTELLDCVMNLLLNKRDTLLIEENIESSTIESAKSIAKYYRSDMKHYEAVCENACTIFERLKKIHGLNQRKKLLLQLACIMHECGNNINLKNSDESVFNAIKNTNVYGLSFEENLIVAYIAGLDEFSLKRYENELNKNLSVKNKLIASKLKAIFIIANALDVSSKQKLCEVKAGIIKGEVIITGTTDKNTLFEQWEFKRCRDFFEEVFGVKIRLLVKPKNLSI